MMEPPPVKPLAAEASRHREAFAVSPSLRTFYRSAIVPATRRVIFPRIVHLDVLDVIHRYIVPYRHASCQYGTTQFHGWLFV